MEHPALCFCGDRAKAADGDLSTMPRLTSLKQLKHNCAPAVKLLKHTERIYACDPTGGLPNPLETAAQNSMTPAPPSRGLLPIGMRKSQLNSIIGRKNRVKIPQKSSKSGLPIERVRSSQSGAWGNRHRNFGRHASWRFPVGSEGWAGCSIDRTDQSTYSLDRESYWGARPCARSFTKNLARCRW
jgi:hypothetical protein